MLAIAMDVDEALISARGGEVWRRAFDALWAREGSNRTCLRAQLRP
jgi:hypothetical protein